MRRISFPVARVAAFSLLEVIVALGVFSGAILVIIGLSSPLQRSVSDIVDAEVAASLVKNIESELQRIGYARLMASPLLPRLSDASEDPLIFFATPDGNRVLIDIDADNPLNSGEHPGIAERDRYFRIRLVGTSVPDPSSGWLSIRGDVSWPYRIPAGPTTADATAAGQDPSQETPEAKRSSMCYFFALVP